MIRLLAALLTVGLGTTAANAACFGRGAFQTCYDAEGGNSYSVQRFGNATYMQGYNRNTDGQTNSRSWSPLTSYGGGGSAVYGSDSQGRGWSYVCGPHGCY
jgi:hypothetical protein